jgi:chemotaxis protein MotA
MLRRLIREGIVALQSGNNPIIIRERLNAYLNPDARAALAAAQEQQFSKAAE